MKLPYNVRSQCPTIPPGLLVMTEAAGSPRPEGRSLGCPSSSLDPQSVCAHPPSLPSDLGKNWPLSCMLSSLGACCSRISFHSLLGELLIILQVLAQLSPPLGRLASLLLPQRPLVQQGSWHGRLPPKPELLQSRA